ncbi:hypothetical protein KDD30_21990 (plasmid) [Photobacterium sp. GJ3]|uniref:hypothetical protein n=1 Tax=Photobacterium sp. GJ3 TaxID=2829502 RepID=UPI001B8A9C38|nr:hypothetical protein [Photobacterium sp. GJ3]QUJ69434.1 hypothetical protein KDD30_21990 [Photobacterium sp. GJ3]
MFTAPGRTSGALTSLGSRLRGNDELHTIHTITVIPAQAGIHKAPGFKRVQNIIEQIKSQQGSNQSVESFTAPRRCSGALTSLGSRLRGNDKLYKIHAITVIPAKAGIHGAPGYKHTKIIMEQIKSQQGSGHSVISFTAPRRSSGALTSLGSRLRGNDKLHTIHTITVIPAQAGIHKAPGYKHTIIIMEQIKSQQDSSHSVISFTAPRRSSGALTSLGSRLRGNDKLHTIHTIAVIPAQAGIHKAPGYKHTKIIMEQIKSQQGSNQSVESFTALRRGSGASTSLGSRLRGNDKGLINHHITVIPAQAGIHKSPGYKHTIIIMEQTNHSKVQTNL